MWNPALFFFKSIYQWLDIFPLISLTLSVSTNWLKRFKIISWCDVKHIMMLSTKTITPVLKSLLYIISIIAAFPFRLPAILVIMSVSSFKISMIVNVLKWYQAKLINKCCVLNSYECSTFRSVHKLIVRQQLKYKTNLIFCIALCIVRMKNNSTYNTFELSHSFFIGCIYFHLNYICKMFLTQLV